MKNKKKKKTLITINENIKLPSIKSKGDLKAIWDKFSKTQRLFFGALIPFVILLAIYNYSYAFYDVFFKEEVQEDYDYDPNIEQDAINVWNLIMKDSLNKEKILNDSTYSLNDSLENAIDSLDRLDSLAKIELDSLCNC